MTGFMGFTSQIPVHQVSGWLELWVTTGYGLSQLWVITVSTVEQRWNTAINNYFITDKIIATMIKHDPVFMQLIEAMW